MKSLNLKTSGVILLSAWIATAPLLNVKAQQASKPIVIEHFVSYPRSSYQEKETRYEVIGVFHGISFLD